MTFVVGVDIGGTFTDAVAIDENGNMWYSKVPTTPKDRTIGVMNSIRAVAETIGISISDLLGQTTKFAHGTTATVNAMVQLSGVKTGLITTKGFKDHLILMKAHRAFGLPDVEMKTQWKARKPEPLVGHDLTEEVTERVDYAGRILVPLNAEEAKHAIKNLVDKGAESIAVSLLWSFRNPKHEQMIGKLVKEVVPEMHVTLASDVAPIMGEYERTFTAVANSYLGPVLAKYVHSLQAQLKENGLRYPCLLMQSIGGLLPATEAPQWAATTMISGLAGGVIASKYIGELLGFDNVITSDMGGTSFEVGIIYEGQPIISVNPMAPRLGPYISRWTMAVPTIDITAIGSGGGSIAWLDEGSLKVGPISAESEPGPACYNRGGTEPTVCDVDLTLGYLNPDYFLGGKMRIYKELAHKAIKENIADPLGIDVVDASKGIYEVANNQMADLTQKVTLQRGHDPREFVNICFGGAGPMHVSIYGMELGVKGMLVPGKGFATAHSAFGVAVSDLSRSFVVTDYMREPFDAERVNEDFSGIESKAIDTLRRWGVKNEDIFLFRSGDMRFKRQVHEVDVPIPGGLLTPKDVEMIIDRFVEKYERLYGKGTAHREAGVEIINFRVDAIGKVAKPILKKYKTAGSDPSAALKTKRTVFWKKYSDFAVTNIFDGDKLLAGNEIVGPAVIEFPGTTVVIHPDQLARIDEYLNVLIERGK